MGTHFLWVFPKDFLIFPLKEKKWGRQLLREEKQFWQAKLKACKEIAIYQTRLVLIWFLNPCVIKTAKENSIWGGGVISQMLRPSVSVTRKVILRFKWTNLKLVRALTLPGKRGFFFFSCTQISSKEIIFPIKHHKTQPLLPSLGFWKESIFQICL